MSVLCLGILLGAPILPLHAGDRAAQLINGKNIPLGGMQPGVPQSRRPTLRCRQRVIDRGTPISERPFAKPFIDRAAPPYPSARWRLSGEEHRLVLAPCPHLVSWGMGEGRQSVHSCTSRLTYGFLFLRATDVVALLPS